MDYVRARRLSQAALRLADGAEDILGLALGTGYGSHEAFSRAFKRRFGVTPEEVRKRRSTDGLNLIGAGAIRVPKRADLAPPRIVDGPEVLAVGLSVRYDFFDASSIPAQWQTFMRDLIDRVPNRVPGIPFSITADLRDDLTFAYITAAEVSRIDDVPSPLTSIRLPSRRWAVFHHPGHVSAIPTTYAAIWDYGFHDQGLTVEAAPSMERHCPTFDPRTAKAGRDLDAGRRRRREVERSQRRTRLLRLAYRLPCQRPQRRTAQIAMPHSDQRPPLARIRDAVHAEHARAAALFADLAACGPSTSASCATPTGGREPRARPAACLRHP